MSVVRGLPEWVENQIEILKSRAIEVAAFTKGTGLLIRFCMPKCETFDLHIFDDAQPVDLVAFHDYVETTLKPIKLSKKSSVSYNIRTPKFGIDITHTLSITPDQCGDLLSVFCKKLEDSQRFGAELFVEVHEGLPVSISMISNKRYIKYTLTMFLQDLGKDIKSLRLSSGQSTFDLKCANISNGAIVATVNEVIERL